MFYKTASDTINYVSWRCSDVDSTATTVVFLPLIHLSSSSSHPFSPPSPSPSLPLCHCALNPVLSQRIRQSHALKPAAERGKVCVCVIVFCERGRGRGRKLSCTVGYIEQPAQQWMMLHPRGGRQTGRTRHSWPRFIPHKGARLG